MKRNKYIYKSVIVAAVVCVGVVFTACDSFEMDADVLTEALDDAWEEMDDPVTDCAECIAEELADYPNRLMKDVEGDWSSFGDEFTLQEPYNYVAAAAATAILGEWGELLMDIADAGRSVASKDYAVKKINKNYNQDWTSLFNALIYLDGTFVYSIETDEFSDNDFEFKPKELATMLRDRGLWKGEYSLGAPTE